jgi:hypothetical protein
MGVGSEATVLHGGWVGAGEAVGCNVAVGAVAAGAQALRKMTKSKKQKKRGIFFFIDL